MVTWWSSKNCIKLKDEYFRRGIVAGRVVKTTLFFYDGRGIDSRQHHFVINYAGTILSGRSEFCVSPHNNFSKQTEYTFLIKIKEEYPQKNPRFASAALIAAHSVKLKIFSEVIFVSPRWGDTAGNMAAVSFTKKQKRFDRGQRLFCRNPLFRRKIH